MKRACETRAAGPAKPGMYIQNNQERLLSSLDAPLDKAEPGEGTRAKILASSKGADVDTVLTVRDALAQLDELERAIAVASFIEGRRAPEIAELLGRSEEEIRKLRRTVRDKLTVMLGGLNG
jgi:DNA-directed RNA polymerase specialized sigma24 family protein